MVPATNSGNTGVFKNCHDQLFVSFTMIDHDMTSSCHHDLGCIAIKICRKKEWLPSRVYGTSAYEGGGLAVQLFSRSSYTNTTIATINITLTTKTTINTNTITASPPPPLLLPLPPPLSPTS